MANILNRLNSHMFLGAKVWFCPFGASVGEAQKAGLKVAPEPPKSLEDPGDWTVIGGIDTASIERDTEEKEVQRVLDDGVYHITKLPITKAHTIKFETFDITPESFQLSLGLLKGVEEGGEQKAFASGNDMLEGWLYFAFTESFRANGELANMLLCGLLSMDEALGAQNDLAKSKFKFDVLDNPLNMFNPTGLLSLGDAAE